MIFTERWDYSNWELSADRANAARRSLSRYGIKEEKVAQVVGLASSVLYDKDHPDNPINRRISILVMNEQADRRLKQQQDSDALPPDPDFGGDKPEAEAAPEKQTLNQFEAFERLRKTMTKKNAESKPAPQSDKGSDFFE